MATKKITRKPAKKMAVRRPAAKKPAVKKAVKAPAGNINVKLATLVKDIEVKNIKKGTTLAAFLKENGLTYGANIRVNTTAVAEDYKLQNGDIVCVVTQVAGGSR